MERIKQLSYVLITLVLISAELYAKEIVISTFEGVTANTESATRIMTQAYQKLSIDMLIKQLPGERSILSANSASVDGELYRKKGIEKSYPNLIRVPVGILSVEFVVFTKDVVFPVNGWESLKPYRVGYMRGTKIVEMNLEEGTYAESVNSDEQNFLKLAAGRIDAVVTSRRRGLAMLKKLKLTDIKMLEEPVYEFDSFHYLNKKNRSLVIPLTAILSSMESDGTIRLIQGSVDKEWFE